MLERRKEIAPRLLDFEKEGTLTIVETPGADVAAVADIVCEIEADVPLILGDGAALEEIWVCQIVNDQQIRPPRNLCDALGNLCMTCTDAEVHCLTCRESACADGHHQHWDQALALVEARACLTCTDAEVHSILHC